MTINIAVAMGVFGSVRDISSDNAQTFHECRNCGLSPDINTDECPHCGSPEIASYHL